MASSSGGRGRRGGGGRGGRSGTMALRAVTSGRFDAAEASLSRSFQAVVYLLYRGPLPPGGTDLVIQHTAPRRGSESPLQRGRRLLLSQNALLLRCCHRCRPHNTATTGTSQRVSETVADRGRGQASCRTPGSGSTIGREARHPTTTQRPQDAAEDRAAAVERGNTPTTVVACEGPGQPGDGRNAELHVAQPSKPADQ
jgi:hypothetical protein